MSWIDYLTARERKAQASDDAKREAFREWYNKRKAKRKAAAEYRRTKALAKARGKQD